MVEQVLQKRFFVGGGELSRATKLASCWCPEGSVLLDISKVSISRIETYMTVLRDSMRMSSQQREAEDLEPQRSREAAIRERNVLRRENHVV